MVNQATFQTTLKHSRWKGTKTLQIVIHYWASVHLVSRCRVSSDAFRKTSVQSLIHDDPLLLHAESLSIAVKVGAVGIIQNFAEPKW